MNSTPETTLPLAPWPFLAPPEAKDEIGRLAGYRVLKLLGKGGMGMVFQAEDPQLRRLVALKVMLPDVAAGEQSHERFLREARAAAKLKHDHVVTIYQVGEDRGVPFLAMEFLKGKSLADWLSSGKRPTVGETLLIGRQIAKGLAAAHQAGLVHRDIKPANLWLEAPAGRVKILDFGLARTNERDVSLMTEQGAVVGTPAFMAPEQARGETVTPRSDLFSLGCVLYRLAAGRPPFTGDSLVAVLSAVLSQTPRNVRELNSDVPEPLAVLIERLLAKDPNQRPASAQEVQEELAAIGRELKSSGDTARFTAETLKLDSAAVKATPHSSRTWIIAAACTAIASMLAVTGIGIGAYVAGNRSNGLPEREPPTLVATTINDDEPELAETKTQSTSPPQPAADGNSIDLMALIEADRDDLQGNWHKDSDDLLGWSRKGPYTLVLPWVPPDEYRLKMRVVRSGPGHLAIGLESSNTRFLLLIGFSNKDRHLTGLAMWDNVPLARRPDVRFGKVFAPNIPVEVIVTVKKESLTLSLGGREVYSIEGDLTRAAMPLAPGGSLVIGGGGGEGTSSFRFEAIALEPLGSDRGKPLHASAE